MYKVFFKDRTLFLTDSLEQDLSINFNAIHKYTSHHELSQFIQNFESKDELQTAFVYGRTKDFLLGAIKKCFRFITAAGGFVVNHDEDVLVIHRLGVYDLPKGKTEKGESPKQTALREVEEECGLDNLKADRFLCSTYHTYVQKGIHFLKETAWYHMTYDGNKTPNPQVEEQIVSAEWLSVIQLEKVIKNTYPSIIEVIKSAGY